ncbi:imidazole glycerol phosphate synthase subunit HisH [Erysipelotrichaceae bacterium RD49]|nr:imidazole glycerol phosphate synthase subunit HisH [Erysipelotrichaceae bacterium RD49]
MIGIIDYGMGNLHSVASACAYLNLPALISSDPNELAQCDKLILPGVGAFGDMEKILRETGLGTWLKNQVRTNKIPLLGICLGMQALFEKSYEFGEYEGLGFLEGEVTCMEPVRFHDQEKEIVLPVPQIGWNKLHTSTSFPIYGTIEADPYVYFDHSYLAAKWNPADLVAYAQYGPYTVPAVVMKENVMGCQFHPEKSGVTGLRILEWFGKEFCS